MSTETIVSPAEETQIPTAETTTEPAAVDAPKVEAEQPQEPDESEDSKAVKRMQRRIDKRTADLYRERAEKDQLAQRLAQLEARLQPEQGNDAPDSVPRAEVLTKAQEIAQEIAQQDRIKESVGKVLSDGKGLRGFDAACNAVNEELPFYDDRGKPTPFLASVLEFDAPAQLLHHLGTHPDLAAELADLSPIKRIRRLDAIERELTAKPAPPKTSSAPKPLEPVKASAGSKDPADMTDKEFAAWRRSQIAQRK